MWLLVVLCTTIQCTNVNPKAMSAHHSKASCEKYGDAVAQSRESWAIWMCVDANDVEVEK